MFLRFIVSLIGFSFVLFPHSISATLFVQGDIDATCKEVCEYKGYRCDKRAFKHMDCRDEVTNICKHTAGDPSDHTLRCQIGGCYGQCGGTSNTVYYDLDTKNDYCTRSSSCLQRGYGKFFQVCPCNKDLLRSDGGDGEGSGSSQHLRTGSRSCEVRTDADNDYPVTTLRDPERLRAHDEIRGLRRCLQAGLAILDPDGTKLVTIHQPIR